MSETINLGVKHEKQIQQQFTIGSLLKGRLENNIDFVGVRTVRVHTISSAPMNDYDRQGESANRYGVPREVGDSMQELTMTQDKSFARTIDKGNNLDQAINKAGKFLRIQLDEKAIPMMDAYGFAVLAKKSGKTVVGAALDKDNIITAMSAARTHMLNKRVPIKGRTWYVSGDVYNALVGTPQFIALEKLGGKAVAQGQIGEIFGAPIIEVPEELLPIGVKFILVHKSAATSPSKINDTKVHIDPPGISGSLVEGRFYWDTFVFGAKADGVYVYIDNITNPTVKKLIAVTINQVTGAVSGAVAGANVKYTVDGSDPRYSSSAVVGTTPALAGKAATVKAYQYNDTEKETYPSDVVAVDVAGTRMAAPMSAPQVKK